MQILNNNSGLPLFELHWEVTDPIGSGSTLIRASSIVHARRLFKHYFPKSYTLVNVNRA